MKNIIVILFLISNVLFSAETLIETKNEVTAQEILKRIDYNQIAETSKFNGKMIIYKNSKKLVKEFEGIGTKVDNRFLMTYKNSEDLGVKYLKLKKEIWIYFPDADDVIKISGHMLRQGMMGSDISYEDMLDLEELQDRYSAKVVRNEIFGGVECAVLELGSLKKGLTYPKQVLYVDTKRFFPLKVELYTKSNRMLKTIEYSDFKEINKRWFPAVTVFKDLRKKNSKTVVEYSLMEFDVSIPESAFSKRALYQ